MNKNDLQVIGSQVIGTKMIEESWDKVNPTQDCTLNIIKRKTDGKFCLTWAELLISEYDTYKQAEIDLILLMRKKKRLFFGVTEIDSFFE